MLGLALFLRLGGRERGREGEREEGMEERREERDGEEEEGHECCWESNQKYLINHGSSSHANPSTLSEH